MNANPLTPLTPGQHATAYAKAHPDFSGKLDVITITPKGKGGWGRTRKYTLFYVNGGKAAQTLHKNNLRNGQCMVCEKVFTERILVFALIPDPLAGIIIPATALSEWKTEHYGTQIPYHSHRWASVCPACTQEAGVITASQLPVLDVATLPDGTIVYVRNAPETCERRELDTL